MAPFDTNRGLREENEEGIEKGVAAERKKETEKTREKRGKKKKNFAEKSPTRLAD